MCAKMDGMSAIADFLVAATKHIQRLFRPWVLPLWILFLWVWSILAEVHLAAFVVEKWENVKMFIHSHPWPILALAILGILLVAVWPEIAKSDLGKLLRLPKTPHQKLHELHHAIFAPQIGHCDRIEAVESKLKTDFATVADVQKRDLQVATTALEAIDGRTAGIEKFLKSPPKMFGTVWITINSQSVYSEGEESRFTYNCNCLNIGGNNCTIKKVLIHLDHTSFDQDVESVFLDQELIDTAPLGTFEKSGQIKVPLVSTVILRQVRFENARLIYSYGKSHYVDVRVSDTTILDRTASTVKQNLDLQVSGLRDDYSTLKDAMKALDDRISRSEKSQHRTDGPQLVMQFPGGIAKRGSNDMLTGAASEDPHFWILRNVGRRAATRIKIHETIIGEYRLTFDGISTLGPSGQGADTSDVIYMAFKGEGLWGTNRDGFKQSAYGLKNALDSISDLADGATVVLTVTYNDEDREECTEQIVHYDGLFNTISVMPSNCDRVESGRK